MTLRPFQYQLGNIKFGRDTEVPISKIDIMPYNVNAQDFQVPRTDENRFGIDSLAPGPINFTMAVLQNWVLNSSPQDGIVHDDLFAAEGTILPQMAATWKNRPVRMTWGQAVPLLCCDKYGVVRRIYGRPGKFTHAARYRNNQHWIDVMAEFRRADTFAHNDIEYYVADPIDPLIGLAPGAPPVTAHRADGDADSWLRILLEGPFTHPIVTYGENTIELNITVEAGVTVEISSYPWQRRIVDSEGINHRAHMIGDTQYLDQIQFPAGGEFDVSWQATATTSDSGLFFMWREAYNVI